jgi:hypothetical protein
MDREHQGDDRPVHLIQTGQGLKDEPRQREPRQHGRQESCPPRRSMHSRETERHEDGQPEQQRVELEEVLVSVRHDVIGQRPEHRQDDPAEPTDQPPEDREQTEPRPRPSPLMIAGSGAQ